MAASDSLAARYDVLKTEIDGYIKYSCKWMRVWAVFYYSLRTALIVLSACVAAKGTLPFTDRSIQFLSLVVAIGTSLDTWLKTGNRFRGHYTFNDKFIALCTDLELTSSQNAEGISSIQDQFKKLIDAYAVAVLPT